METVQYNREIKLLNEEFPGAEKFLLSTNQAFHNVGRFLTLVEPNPYIRNLVPQTAHGEKCMFRVTAEVLCEMEKDELVQLHSWDQIRGTNGSTLNNSDWSTVHTFMEHRYRHGTGHTVPGQENPRLIEYTIGCIDQLIDWEAVAGGFHQDFTAAEMRGYHYMIYNTLGAEGGYSIFRQGKLVIGSAERGMERIDATEPVIGDRTVSDLVIHLEGLFAYVAKRLAINLTEVTESRSDLTKNIVINYATKLTYFDMRRRWYSET